MFSRSKVAPITSPTIAPPTTEAIVPPIDIAPLVPGGTCSKVVTNRGFDRDKIPSSEARVSPRQHANCLYHNQPQSRRAREEREGRRHPPQSRQQQEFAVPVSNVDIERAPPIWPAVVSRDFAQIQGFWNIQPPRVCKLRLRTLGYKSSVPEKSCGYCGSTVRKHLPPISIPRFLVPVLQSSLLILPIYLEALSSE